MDGAFTTWKNSNHEGYVGWFDLYVFKSWRVRWLVWFVCFVRYFYGFFTLLVATISSKWCHFGVAGAAQDVDIVMDALSGKGILCSLCLLSLARVNLLWTFLFTTSGKWPKKRISNRDVLRLDLACDVMELDARKSIYYTAINAFGDEGVNTTM